MTATVKLARCRCRPSHIDPAACPEYGARKMGTLTEGSRRYLALMREQDPPRTYNIVRFYRDAAVRRRIIAERVTLAEAQAHCQDPETSSSTARSASARARTRRVGAWFDGYEGR